MGSICNKIDNIVTMFGLKQSISSDEGLFQVLLSGLVSHIFKVLLNTVNILTLFLLTKLLKVLNQEQQSIIQAVQTGYLGSLDPAMPTAM